MATECDAAIPAPDLSRVVEEVVAQTPSLDMHTHLFAPSMGSLGLWGIDELLTYHYLEAELFRFSNIAPEAYWSLSKPQQADLIWTTLFVQSPPLSESTRGVVAVLCALGLDTSRPDLTQAREYFRDQQPSAHIDRVLQLSGVASVVMTNDPLDPAEIPHWTETLPHDPRFHAALRLDRMLNDWPAGCASIAAQGFEVSADLSGRTMHELRRFLELWMGRMRPAYVAVSLPDTFQFPAPDARTRLLREVVLPLCAEGSLSLSLMIGVRRQVNPALRLAGDASGRANLLALERLCVEHPGNRFLVSLLSLENQHELCVYARKFANLTPFGCWWFLNNPSLVTEITRMRLEMLGTSFIPQHSDARVLEQLIYKWRNTRRTLAPVLAERLALLAADGRPCTRKEIAQATAQLFRTNFEQCVKSEPRL